MRSQKAKLVETEVEGEYQSRMKGVGVPEGRMEGKSSPKTDYIG